MRLRWMEGETPERNDLYHSSLEAYPPWFPKLYQRMVYLGALLGLKPAEVG